jgi:hypothetical protein
MPFRWCVRCLQVEKIPIPLCFWKRHGVFFLLEWRVMSTVTRFITSDVIFSLLISKLVLAMQIFIVVFWFMGISSLVPNILISNLCFWLFCNFCNCFQFYPSIGICDFFSIWFSFFWFISVNWFLFSIKPFNKKIISFLF